MAIPILLYGSETWTLTSNQLRRIEAAEMKLLRILAGYTLYNHKRTKLNMTPILDAIKNYRNNCHAHVLRMPYNRLPQRIFHYRPDGRRDIGRPRKRWKDQFSP
ncbi:hypothetical protein C0J52_11288 [Blattella germanica]|nr:hypothetical protein C0J52_11288 [Blattella germanica]